jgi:hypothetical protein
MVHSNVVSETVFDLLLAVLMTLNLNLEKMVQVGIVCAVEESTGLRNYLFGRLLRQWNQTRRKRSHPGD